MPKHITTFENGLNQDVNVLNQPLGTYRDLQNGMLISYDGNHYVVETALGNKVNFTIPPRYAPPDGQIGVPSSWTLDTPALPIGFISFIDKLVVFSTNSVNGGYGEIGTVVFDNAGNGTYTPIYNDVNLNFAKLHKIFGFTYTENDKINRVYWTDYFNELRVINTSDPFITTPIPSTGPLVNLTRYMVVNGAVEYPTGSGQFYGPGLTGGNIFTATTVGGTSYTVADNGNNPSGVPIVIQYIDYHLLSFNPDRKMSSIDFNRWLSGGSYNGGSKMFFTRLGLKNAGYVTSWSYGSFPINVSGPSFTNWKDQQGSGAQGLSNSTRGIEIKVSNIDTNFDTIEVAVADFDQKNNVLTDAKVVVSTNITGSTMLFQTFGSENIKTLSVNDLTIFPASIRNAKDLCTAKNYIVIANLKERDEIDFDATTVTIADTVYRVPADNRGNQPNMQQGTDFNEAIGQTPTYQNLVLPDGKYQVSGGNAVYNGVTYGVGQPAGDIFIGVPGNAHWTNGGGNPVVHAVIVIEKYIDSGGNPVNKVIPILDDYWDYKGMATTQYLRNLWTNETYRWAILYYDLKGNPYFARFVGDHQVWAQGTNPPTGITNKGGLLINRTASAIPNWSLQINGVKFSGINISPTLAAQISGFSIVRAPRDRQYYAQGLVFPTVRDSLGNNTFHPLAQAETGHDDNYTNHGAPFGAYTWHSPDALCLSSIFNAPATGNKLEGEAFVTAIDLANGGTASGFAPNSSFTKYYNPDLSFPFSVNISTYAMIPPDGTYNGFAGGTFENSFLRTNGIGNPPNSEAKGGNCSLVQCGGIQYNGFDIADTPNQFSAVKAIANYKISKGILYGGQSADAIANTPFISTGHFQEITPTVLAGLPTTTIGGVTYYQFNNVEVYGGDSFISIMDHVNGLWDDTLPNPYSYGVFFPVESNVNHSLRQALGDDRLLAKDGMNGTGNGVVFREGGKTRLEAFFVNDAYTSDGDVFEYPALPVNFNTTDKFPFRVRWAGPKISGERYDTFRVFLLNNFRDLDGQRGEINNVASKQDKVYAWQNHGVAYLPILERQLVSGTIGQATQLGVGGVIDRFDAYDTYFGNQHQSSLVDTEFGFSWFDMRKRAWLVMNIMGQHEEISVTKGLQSFFNSIFETHPFANAIISTDTPLVGIGIHGVYDARFKTTLLTFKWYQGSDVIPYVNYDFTVGYNHIKNVIVGFFPGMTPAIWHQHNRQLISAKDAGSPTIIGNHHYAIGAEVSKNASEYVSVDMPSGFTTHSVPQSYEQPDFAGSLLWTKMFSENEIYNHWTGDICKFYGRVYPFILQAVVNPKTGEAFAVDNLQIKSSPVNFDKVACNTDNDTAQDVNLNLGNRNYRYIDNSWFSTVPLGKKGRLTDYYLIVKMTLNNFVNNPTIAINKQKVVEFIGSMFRIKL